MMRILALLLLAVATPATARADVIAILAPSGDAALDAPLAARLLALSEEALQALGHEALLPSALAEPVDPDDPCEGSRCYPRLLASSGADRLLIVSAWKREGEVSEVMASFFEHRRQGEHRLHVEGSVDLQAALRGAIAGALASLAEPDPIYTLRLEGEPEGATVVIDGIPRGQLPIQLGLPAGEHQIGLSAPGHRSLLERIELDESRTLQLRMEAREEAREEGSAWPSYLLGGGLLAASLPFLALSVADLLELGQCEAGCLVGPDGHYQVMAFGLPETLRLGAGLLLLGAGLSVTLLRPLRVDLVASPGAASLRLHHRF